MPDWRGGLMKLCVTSTKDLPEAYLAVIETWKQALLPSRPAQDIILLFEEVRARPLDDLSDCPKSMSPYQVPLILEPRRSDKETRGAPQEVLEQLDLPETCFRLDFRVCTSRKKGRHLIRKIVRGGDPSGLLCAELIKELRIVWQ